MEQSKESFDKIKSEILKSYPKLPSNIIDEEVKNLLIKIRLQSAKYSELNNIK